MKKYCRSFVKKVTGVNGAMCTNDGCQSCKDRFAAYDDTRGFWRKTPLT